MVFCREQRQRLSRISFFCPPAADAEDGSLLRLLRLAAEIYEAVVSDDLNLEEITYDDLIDISDMAEEYIQAENERNPFLNAAAASAAVERFFELSPSDDWENYV